MIGTRQTPPGRTGRLWLPPLLWLLPLAGLLAWSAASAFADSSLSTVKPLPLATVKPVPLSTVAPPGVETTESKNIAAAAETPAATPGGTTPSGGKAATTPPAASGNPVTNASGSGVAASSLPAAASSGVSGSPPPTAPKSTLPTTPQAALPAKSSIETGAGGEGAALPVGSVTEADTKPEKGSPVRIGSLEPAPLEMEAAIRAARARADNPPQGPYHYLPEGKRDPFSSPLTVRSTPSESEPLRPPIHQKRGNKGPLDAFPLDSLQLVAIVLIEADDQALAMVQDPSGKGHTVRIGDSIGMAGGEIMAIGEGEMSIREPTPTRENPQATRVTTLRLANEETP
ncbi:MAG: pilus assembly protein PilP [Magnetococcales bacterium]|nr:pilus assembly protein PilP [Magnetococcales bacterium]